MKLRIYERSVLSAASILVCLERRLVKMLGNEREEFGVTVRFSYPFLRGHCLRPLSEAGFRPCLLYSGVEYDNTEAAVRVSD